MKKLLIAVLVNCIMLSSCEKEDKICWDCTFGQQINGYVRPAETVCNEGQPPTFKDAQGNDIPSYCRKK